MKKILKWVAVPVAGYFTAMLALGFYAGPGGTSNAQAADDGQAARAHQLASREETSWLKKAAVQEMSNDEISTVYDRKDMVQVDIASESFQRLQATSEAEALLVEMDGSWVPYDEACSSHDYVAFNQTCAGKAIKGTVRVGLSSAADRDIVFIARERTLQIASPSSAHMASLFVTDLVQIEGRLLEAQYNEINRVQLQDWRVLPRGANLETQRLWRAVRISEICRRTYFSQPIGFPTVPLFSKAGTLLSAAVSYGHELSGSTTIRIGDDVLRCLVKDGKPVSAHTRYKRNSGETVVTWKPSVREPGWETGMNSLTSL